MGWRIYFTADDLARTTIAPTLGPLAETMFGLSLLRGRTGPRNGLALWRRAVRGRLTPQMRPLAALAPIGLGVDLWTLTGEAPTIEHGLAALLAMPPAHVRAELEFMASDSRLPPSAWEIADEHRDDGRRALVTAAAATYRALLEPYWTRVSSHLHAERAARSRALLEGGVERLLATLSPMIRWRSPVLHVAMPQREFELHLGGRGLVLVPSLFVGERPALLMDLAHGDAPARLVFPVAHDPALWDGAATAGSLAALLGRTRAAALERIADGCSTSELANHLGVSAAAASQHATVLRDNGLITTRRDGGSVWHTVTTLGAQLLRVDP